MSKPKPKIPKLPRRRALRYTSDFTITVDGQVVYREIGGRVIVNRLTEVSQ